MCKEPKEVIKMGEQMTFPNTFKEFAELYKTVDTKEVYSNGIEFLPIFRVEQWLEYISAVEMATFESTINSLQEQLETAKAENERLKEPTSASAIHILAEKAIESLQKENEEYKTEIMRLEHNVRVLSENSIIAKYPHHWLLDEGWFLSKELDGYGKFKAQVSNEAIIGFVGRLKAKAEVFPELRLIVIKEKDWDNLLKEFGGSEV